jgi:ABC-type bacteriocin/lantibiotic exporter with double-glycine peptidase domain
MIGMTREEAYAVAPRTPTWSSTEVEMEAGQIVEHGTHASLLAAGGAYVRLYEAQFAAPVAEV